MSQRYDEIRSTLNRGFFVDNLREVSSLCLALLQEDVVVSHPAVLFTIATTADNIVRAWEDVPITAKTADRVQKQLMPQLQALLAMAASDSLTACSILDKAAASFGQVLRQGLDSELT